jgi:fumarate hydratase subunit beta
MEPGAPPIRLRLPLSAQDAAALQLGDMVLLDGPIVATAGIPTHKRIEDCIDRGEAPPIDLTHAAFFHLGSYSRDTADGGLEVLYMNPTTSTRFNDVMPRIIRHFGLRAVGGKGGLDRGCAQALADVGGVYLSFLGGGATLITAAIRQVRQVAWGDLIAHYRLVRIEVQDLGPLTVAIDARGNSIYDDLATQARARRDAILARMDAQRQGG